MWRQLFSCDNVSSNKKMPTYTIYTWVRYKKSRWHMPFYCDRIAKLDLVLNLRYLSHNRKQISFLPVRYWNEVCCSLNIRSRTSLCYEIFPELRISEQSCPINYSLWFYKVYLLRCCLDQPLDIILALKCC